MDRTTRTIGLIVFALGICMLFLVFGTALWLFTGPAERLLPGGVSSGPATSLGGLGSAAALIFVRIALLFIMALVGSMIAGRGIDLYFGSRGRRGQDAAS